MGLFISGMPDRLKAVFFDMDGVLVDVSGSYRRAIQETAAHFTGKDVSPELIQEYKNQGGFNDDWELTHAIVREHSADVPLSEVIDQFQLRYRGKDWDGFISTEPPLFDTSLLQQVCADGRVVALVTGRPEEEAKWTLRRFGWDRLFPVVIGMESQQGRGKPDPFPLVRALEACDAEGKAIRPEEAAYVGDSVDDVIAARAAGMWAIGIVPPYLDVDQHAEVLRVRGAHLVLRDPAELPDAVEHFFERISGE